MACSWSKPSIAVGSSSVASIPKCLSKSSPLTLSQALYLNLGLGFAWHELVMPNGGTAEPLARRPRVLGLQGNSLFLGAARSSEEPLHKTALLLNALRLTVQQNANNSICSGSRPRAISIKADCHRKLTGPCLAHRTQRRLMDDTPPEHSLEAN